jgi:hypothetical protein
MIKLAYSVFTAVAAVLISFAAAMAGTAAANAEPTDGASCSSGCGVGAAGQGGTSSGGSAQGSYYNGPGRVTGVHSRAAGTQESGRLELSGGLEGTLSGTFRGDTFRGRTTGIFGDCTGGACAP